MAKDKGGRPTVMTEEVVAKLEEGFLMGFNITEACLYVDISRSIFYDYIKLHPKFSDKIADWQDNPKMLAKKNIYNSIKSGDKTEDSKWFLERKGKDDGFSLRTEHTGKDGKDLMPDKESKKVSDDAIKDYLNGHSSDTTRKEQKS